MHLQVETKHRHFSPSPANSVPFHCMKNVALRHSNFTFHFTAGAIKCEPHCPMRIDKVLRMRTTNTASAVGMKEEINTVSCLLLHLLRLKCRSSGLSYGSDVEQKTLGDLIKATGFNNVTTSETRTAYLTKTQPVLDTGQFLGAFA